MEDELSIPEHDLIDEELLEMIHEIVGEEAEEEEIDAASNIVFNLVEQLVEEGEMDEIPDTDANEEDKQAWLSSGLPVLKEAFALMLSDLASEESDINGD